MASRTKKILQLATIAAKEMEQREIAEHLEIEEGNKTADIPLASSKVVESTSYEHSILSAPIVIDEIEYHFDTDAIVTENISAIYSVNTEDKNLSLDLNVSGVNLDNLSDLNLSLFQDNDDILQEIIVEDNYCPTGLTDGIGIELSETSCSLPLPNEVDSQSSQLPQKDSVNDPQILPGQEEEVTVQNLSPRKRARDQREDHTYETSASGGNKLWKRENTKRRRMLGQTYLGFKRENKKITHDTNREERKQAPTCTSKKCEASKNRCCDAFDTKQRKEIFKKFWQSSWEEKKTYVVNMIEKVDKKRETVDVEQTRRHHTLEYFLKYKNSEKKQVCKKMFLGTLDLKEWMVSNWVNRSEHGFVSSPQQQSSNQVPTENSHSKRLPKRLSEVKKNFAREWLRKLPKLESHYYCRKESKRLYLEGPFETKVQVYNLYCESCKKDNVIPLKRTCFFEIADSEKLSIFKPRKDQCDTCIGYRTKQVSEEEYTNHLNEKKRAREEKEIDKTKAKKGECMAFTIDLQSVNLCPKTQASALYYSMKLKVYNLTIYNLGNSQCSTYWWDECEGELDASVFASILLKHLKKYCSGCSRVVIFSDGCGYQNRNKILSNAVLNFSIENNTIIEHKYLVKGHSQMECDSAHALIERRLKNKDVYLPSDYIKIAKEARKDNPYEATMLDHSYFLDYTDSKFQVYKSIRPGQKKGDPEVRHIRALKYDPNEQLICFKLCFNDDYRALPQRCKRIIYAKQDDYTPLYKSRINLTMSKFNDLQQLKSVIPKDTHFFYDALPHSKKLVERLKKV